MIQVTDSECVVSLADLYTLRHVNWPWTEAVLRTYDTYLSIRGLPDLRSQASPLANLQRQLDAGWVGALLLEGAKPQLIGVTLGHVERYLDALSVYEAAASVRCSRPDDVKQQARWAQCLRDATLRQILWHHLCWGEEESVEAIPRVRHTIFWRRSRANTERYVWHPDTQQLAKR